jgi:hypothetical protein
MFHFFFAARFITGTNLKYPQERLAGAINTRRRLSRLQGAPASESFFCNYM